MNPSQRLLVFLAFLAIFLIGQISYNIGKIRGEASYQHQLDLTSEEVAPEKKQQNCQKPKPGDANNSVFNWEGVIHGSVAAMGVLNCSSLFVKISDEAFYPQHVIDHRKAFDSYVKPLWKGVVEGFSAELREEYMMMHLLASQPAVQTVCEIGFNAGHSSLQWLTANPTARVYSFDIGIHSYTRPMVKYLQTKFPGRLQVIFGDSTKKVPEFAASHPEVKCDIALVDGGHSIQLAKTDLVNMHKLSHGDTVLLLDDTNPNGPYYTRDVYKAWQQVSALGIADKIFHCVYERRGFLLAKYRHPGE